MSNQPGQVNRTVANTMTPVLAALAFVMTWEAVVRVAEIPRYLLPAPSLVLEVASAKSAVLLADSGVTLLEAALGFAVGTSLAFVVGSLFAVLGPLERAVMPIVVALQAVPLVAVAPLLIIWLGNGLASKVAMAAMICFFPMVINSATGIGNTPAEMIDLMKICGASRAQVFWKARLPNSLPAVFSGLRIAASASVIGAIVSELAGADRGIGFQILSASYRTDTPTLFAAVACAAALGVGFYHLVAAVEKVLFRRMGLPASRR